MCPSVSPERTPIMPYSVLSRLLFVSRPHPLSPLGSPQFNGRSYISPPLASSGWMHAWHEADPGALLLSELTKPPLLCPDVTPPSLFPACGTRDSCSRTPSCPWGSESPRPQPHSPGRLRRSRAGGSHMVLLRPPTPGWLLGPLTRTGEPDASWNPELRPGPAGTFCLSSPPGVPLRRPLPFVERFLLLVIQQEECRFLVN